MQKYLTVFNVSWQNEFIYRLNFILWRFRVILRFLMVYFLWSGIFSTVDSAFGYSQSQMTTYIFNILIVASIVTSSQSLEIGTEIANGNLSNFLVKPINYLKYWFTRDLASKMLNVVFSAVELTVLLAILKPALYLPSNAMTLIFWIISLLLAVGIYFFVSTAVRFYTFWSTDNTWAMTFMFMVVSDLLSGAIFPLDILPGWAQTILQFTPFPYFIYVPAAIFSEKLSNFETIRLLTQSLGWLIFAYLINSYIWKKGLKVYAAEGK